MGNANDEGRRVKFLQCQYPWLIEGRFLSRTWTGVGAKQRAIERRRNSFENARGQGEDNT